MMRWYLKEGKGKPYVISEDIHLLLSEWAKKRGFKLPSIKFFKQLREEMKQQLERIFGNENVDMIPASDLRQGMQRLIKETGLPAVSMDRVYIRTNPAIEVTRVVDDSLNDCGIASRFGTPPIPQQLLTVKEKYTEIILVDDVIFSGKVISEILLFLKDIGVKVPVVVAGITIGEGVRRLREKTKARILSVCHYEEVIDEICERDFYPGVPLSGRTLRGRANIGVSYVLPFGKPFEWASIPKEWEIKFSKFCLRQTVKLWREIEEVSGKEVRNCDIERLPIGFHRDRTRFVDNLRHLLFHL
jgi:hypothetical protein